LVVRVLTTKRGEQEVSWEQDEAMQEVSEWILRNSRKREYLSMLGATTKLPAKSLIAYRVIDLDLLLFASKCR